VRLWSLHPRYLDARGLVALWREGLLAQAVLRGETKGYRHHPQLERFREHAAPLGALAEYLRAVEREAAQRGYAFAADKIDRARTRRPLRVARGQLDHEWRHLLAKLAVRDPRRHAELAPIERPSAHPSFRVVSGGVARWERSDVTPVVQRRRQRDRGRARSRRRRVTVGAGSAAIASADVDDYTARLPPVARAALHAVRKTVRAAAPHAHEVISYRMPALKGHGMLVYYAAFARHVGFYPPVRGDAKLTKALARYAGPKGNLRFPLDAPMPLALIARVVKLRARQDAQKAIALRAASRARRTPRARTRGTTRAPRRRRTA